MLAVLTNWSSAMNYGDATVLSTHGRCRGRASGEGQGAVVGARRQSGTVQLYHGPIVVLLPLEVVILSKVQELSSRETYDITSEVTYLIILSHHICCIRCINFSIGLVRMERLANVALPFTDQS